MTSPAARTIVTRSPDGTRDYAAELAASLPAGTVLALTGDLGSGKTCFVQGLAAGLGVTAAVTSPTFTLINEYRGQLPLYHIDLYRIQDPDELLSLDLEHYLEPDGVTAIEWAERAGDLLPGTAVHIHFEALAEPDHRQITVERDRGAGGPAV